ncbi:MAG: AGE family epimerase/isomerase [Alphaproteobacteria bacterium]|nr:AGE family epimerase/isomerase [Alphaproteobacteria bacterium]MBU2270047.1 AGE family epimerase/isomerase [Alphaproteobacteria bacterium]MBU2417890.1 AGE family epimerase/isomerase [Alphaproteobacteria bacterium]
MVVFPVILCGGAGTRLWPASRPNSPKQFLDLVGDLSLFQETARRVAPLTEGGGRLIIVAGEGHRDAIVQQLAALSLEATVLLEPEGRDSAAAMAAAAVWIRRRSPDGIALFVASDHHIPDAEAFRRSVMAGAPAAADGEIVTFGVRPTGPSSAYGYIEPESPGLSRVRRFVEKPDRERAEAYVRDGFLWNSGNFMVRADVLLAELEAFAPEVAAAVTEAVPETADDIVLLSDAFLGSPRISIDYAVMERSARVSVLPVDFRWSDLGAWDAVAAVEAGQKGVWVGAPGDTCLVRAAEGMVVATAGVRDLAIIVESDAVLVCSLDRAQEVKALVDRIRQTSPAHAEGRTTATLEQQAQAFDRWMRLEALPLWATLGVDEDGGFHETLDQGGANASPFRRARVQARQAWAFSVAGLAGWTGPWSRLVSEGLDRFEATNRRPDGLYRTLVSNTGEVIDDTALLYDQAFALLAFAGAVEAGVEPERLTARAHALREALAAFAHPAGGWREAGADPYQANAHMHLLEACLAWEALEPGGAWTAMADEIVGLARRFFIEPRGGALREFFEADWSPAGAPLGGPIEPGHQFEWAWLLTRWGRARGDDWASAAAVRLYEAGMRGVDAARGVAVDQLGEDVELRFSRARLWPQTERLKAALILGRGGPDGRTAEALKSLRRYLQPGGLWRDKQESDGRFVEEPAPASSLYHIVAAWIQLRETLSVDPGGGAPS